MNDKNIKVLIIRLSALGDIIQSSFILQFIKKNYKNIKIDWLVEKSFSEILDNNIYLDNIFTVELKKVKKEKKISLLKIEIDKIKHLADNNYDYIIDMQGLLKSSIIAKLIAKNSKIKTEIIGYSSSSIRERWASVVYNKKLKIPYEENTIIRNMELINFALDLNMTVDDLLQKQESLFYKKEDFKNINSNYFDNFKNKKILLVIGSTWESRNYPKEKFLEITEKLSTVDFFIIWGNDEEKKRAEFIHQNSKSQNITILPKISLNELKFVVSNMDLIIGNDTGPTHLAWALNKKSITLFGATPVSRILVTKNNLALKSHTIVNPKKLNKKDDSVKTITVDEVLEKIRELIQ
jgi:heptosyltransferase-1